MDAVKWTDVATPVIAVLTLGTTLAIYRARLFEFAAQLHKDLTEGEVAMARNCLGRIAHGHDIGRKGNPTLEEVRRSWFTVLWCMERIRAGRQRLLREPRINRAPVRFLDGLIRQQLDFIDQEASRVRPALQAADPTLDDHQSRQAFQALVVEVLGRQPRCW